MKKFEEWSNVAKGATITAIIGTIGFFVREGFKLITKAINRKADAKAKKEDRQDELNKQKEYEDYKASKRKEATDYAYQKRREEEERKKKAEAQTQQQAQTTFEDDTENSGPLPPIDQDQDFANEFGGNRLFDQIIHKGEIGMIFGPKGCGKSIVTDWIAINIAKGKNIPIFNGVEENAIAETTVLDYDLELNNDDIGQRYGKYGFQFPKNFIRHDKSQIKSTKDILLDIRRNVERAYCGDEIFSVIDTITKVGDITCSQSIKQFIENLEKIAQEASSKGVTLTTLLVSHTTKDFRPGDSLELNDAAGSTDLTRFLNFVIAIESTRISKKHIVLKALNIRGETEPENVVVLKIVDEAPFVHPVVLCEMDEEAVLKFDKRRFEAYLEGLDTKSYDTTDKRKVNKTGLTDEDKHEIFRLHKEGGKSPEELAKMYGPKCKTGTISDTTIRKIIREIDGENESHQQPIA